MNLQILTCACCSMNFGALLGCNSIPDSTNLYCSDCTNDICALIEFLKTWKPNPFVPTGLENYTMSRVHSLRNGPSGIYQLAHETESFMLDLKKLFSEIP